MNATLTIRPAAAADDDAIWAILEPTFRAGETYPIPRDIGRVDALAYWCSPGHSVFVAENTGTIIGTYYLRANQRGGGDHVANCGYMVAAEATGRGVARAMCAHSLTLARERGFTAMQFEPAGGEAVAVLRLYDCRPTAAGVPAPGARAGRRPRDGAGAVAPTVRVPLRPLSR
jgi:GNAT superfamily N-acetyltransferase